MADLDSPAKRESGFGICLPFTRSPVSRLPDGGGADSTDERAHLCMNYNGIAAASPGGATPYPTALLLMGVG